jgi:hypothetical protein
MQNKHAGLVTRLTQKLSIHLSRVHDGRQPLPAMRLIQDMGIFHQGKDVLLVGDEQANQKRGK